MFTKTQVICFLKVLLLLCCTKKTAAAEFITKWNTANPGTSSNTQITIPATGSNYIVSWEQVSNPSYNGTLTATNAVTISFTVSSIYRIKINGDGGTFTRIFFNNAGDRRKILDIEQWGTITWSSMQDAFTGCSNLIVSAVDAPNLSSVTNCARMFSGCSSLNSNFSSWNTANVTNMSSMFSNALVFNGNIGAWNTANVTNMSYMFYNAQAFNQNIGSWNTGNVTNMTNMFAYCNVFNQNIGNWNTANVTDMSFMFYNAQNFNQNIGGWKTGNVTTMAYMFLNCVVFDQNIGSWNTTSVTDMSFMFYNAQAFNQNIGNWNTGNVTTMASMFLSAAMFNQNIGNWNTSNVIDMNAMFSDATSFNQNIGSWSTANVTDMSFMFYNAQSFNQNIGSWNTSHVTSMGFMFAFGIAFNQNIGGWNTANVTDMTFMFYGALVFDQSLGGWNVANVTDMSGMLDDTDLSITNYDNTLIGWSAQVLQNNVPLGANGLQYCNALTQRTSMITTYNWDITGDSYSCVFLPVELVSFNAMCDHKYVTVNWVTASQSNNAYFIIERSDDGIHFDSIASIKGANDHEIKYYEYIDNHPIVTDFAYYRLKQIDHDKHLETFFIVPALCEKGNSSISIYPNPNTGQFNIVGVEANTELIVTDVLGQIITTIFTKKDYSSIDLSEQADGVYFLYQNSDNKQLSQKIIINK